MPQLSKKEEKVMIQILSEKANFIVKNVIQVNLCKKLLFLHQLTPKYDDRLFIELQVQYMKIPSSNLGRTCCVQKLFLTFRTIFVSTQNVLPMFCKKKSSLQRFTCRRILFRELCYLRSILHPSPSRHHLLLLYHPPLRPRPR